MDVSVDGAPAVLGHASVSSTNVRDNNPKVKLFVKYLKPDLVACHA